jgi:uncharacterized membrane protein
MTHSTLGLVHLIASLAALLIGIPIFLRPKLNRLHRALGYLYSISMITLLITALFIYRLTGSFNIFHAFVIISSITLGKGLYHAVARKPTGAWLAFHYKWMTGSYMGLVAAFIAESSTRILLPYLRDHYGIRSFGWFWAIVAAASFVVIAAGKYLQKRNWGILKGYSEALRVRKEAP